MTTYAYGCKHMDAEILKTAVICLEIEDLCKQYFFFGRKSEAIVRSDGQDGFLLLSATEDGDYGARQR